MLVKPIEFTTHALDQMAERGATAEEVADTIRSSPLTQARRGRFECRKDFAFNGFWHGEFYATRQGRPIFVDELWAIVVVTVYVYYF
jgi:hypothetical protein